MLDAPVRRVLAPPLEVLAGGLFRVRVPPLAVTATGWAAGVAACLLGGTGHWTAALAFWLLNRLLDGLDGPLARRNKATELGGFLDLLADFSIYAGFVVAVGVDHPDARIACLVLLTTYYVSGTALLTVSPILERRGRDDRALDQTRDPSPDPPDRRSLLFVGGLAEGTETVLAYVAFCLFPGHAEVIAWVFAAAVAVTACQRTALGVFTLRTPPRTMAVERHRPPAPQELP